MEQNLTGFKDRSKWLEPHRNGLRGWTKGSNRGKVRGGKAYESLLAARRRRRKGWSRRIKRTEEEQEKGIHRHRKENGRMKDLERNSRILDKIEAAWTVSGPLELRMPQRDWRLRVQSTWRTVKGGSQSRLGREENKDRSSSP